MSGRCAGARPDFPTGRSGLRSANGEDHVHTVLIEVSDRDRSVAFWRDGLGIPLAPYGADEKNYHDAWIGGSHLLLHRDFSAATGRSKRAGFSALARAAEQLRRRTRRRADAPGREPGGSLHV
jgi:catechol 2,3-dioxygenase-like lactoylglutathione lyase family enzyme